VRRQHQLEQYSWRTSRDNKEFGLKTMFDMAVIVTVDVHSLGDTRFENTRMSHVAKRGIVTGRQFPGTAIQCSIHGAFRAVASAGKTHTTIELDQTLKSCSRR